MFNIALKKALESPAAKALTAAERADIEKMRIGGLGYFMRGMRQKIMPHWLASMASALYHPFLGGAALGLRVQGKTAQRAGRKIADRQMQKVLRRASTGQTDKQLLKKMAPKARSSPFSAAISGQLNDEERR
jgi:hypothetical protein